MDIFSYIQTNIFALVILLIIGISAFHRFEKLLLAEKIFFFITASIAFMLIIDSLQWYLDGKSFEGIYWVTRIVSVVYYAFTPTTGMLWLLFVHYQIFHDEQSAKKVLFLSLIPYSINLLLSIGSFTTGYLFWFTDQNVYHRGPFFLLHMAIAYSYFAAAMILLLVKRRDIEKKIFVPLLFFAFPPSICGVIQIMFYGVSIVWIGMTVSSLLVYLNSQTNQLYTDPLTGLYNRRQIDYFLNEQIKSKKKHGLLAGVMIDLDMFKSINDTYGHSVGDLALMDTARILKNSVRKDDFIARYGGDEFMLILYVDSIDDIEAIIGRIRDNCIKHNAKSKSPYIIQLSIGYAIYRSKLGLSSQMFINEIDRLMYKDKKKNAALPTTG